MTLKYFCDRCNKLCDKVHYDFNYRGPTSKTKHGYDKSIDLCPTCYEHFEWFMKNKNLEG